MILYDFLTAFRWRLIIQRGWQVFRCMVFVYQRNPRYPGAVFPLKQVVHTAIVLPDNPYICGNTHSLLAFGHTVCLSLPNFITHHTSQIIYSVWLTFLKNSLRITVLLASIVKEHMAILHSLNWKER